MGWDRRGGKGRRGERRVGEGMVGGEMGGEMREGMEWEVKGVMVSGWEGRRGK